MFKDRDDVEDAVQDAFLRLHRALLREEEIDNLHAWVYTVAKHQLICSIRKTNLQGTYKHDLALLAAQWMDEHGSSTPEDVFLDRSRKEALREAQSSLSDLERTCLYARAEGLTLAEVGEAVHLDLRRVHEVVRRAVRKLQTKLQ